MKKEKYMLGKEWFEKAKKLKKKYKSYDLFRKHCMKVFGIEYFAIDDYPDEGLMLVKPNRISQGPAPDNHVFFIPMFAMLNTGEMKQIDTEAKVKKLAPILAKHIDREALITDTLRHISPKDLSEIYDRVITKDKKKKTSIKQKPGCVYLSIGGKPGQPAILMLRN